jgi:hypothetical protein
MTKSEVRSHVIKRAVRPEVRDISLSPRSLIDASMNRMKIS